MPGIIETIKKILLKKTTGAGIALIISFIYLTKTFGKQISSVKLSYFLGALGQNAIAEVFVNGSKLLFRAHNSDVWYQTNTSMLTKDRLYKILSKQKELIMSSADENEGKPGPITSIALFGICYYLGYKIVEIYLQKDSGISSLKNNLVSNTKFSDIHGLDQAKQELQEIIDFLKDPARYKEVGARLRRGVLLYGPSGTGKTLLARATAGESQASFLSCAASEFVELYVGVGPKRVRELFDRARKVAPCIIFIDEIDGIGTKRKSNLGGIDSGSDTERTSTLNQLLTEMDGFKENHDIVVIAATNREQTLDDALMRSGRFDTKIKIELPDKAGRIGIMKIHLRNKQNAVSENVLEEIAKNTNGYSGADLENIVNESAYICVQRKSNTISDLHIQDSFKKISQQRKVLNN